MVASEKDRRRALLSPDTSRQNKVWLVTGWQRDGMAVEWDWAGARNDSRLLFSFAGGPWQEAKSHDEDVMPTLKVTGKPGVLNKPSREPGK